MERLQAEQVLADFQTRLLKDSVRFAIGREGSSAYSGGWAFRGQKNSSISGRAVFLAVRKSAFTAARSAGLP